MELNSLNFADNGLLIDLQRHSHNIARFFIYENPFDDELISPWFRIASEIENVIYKSHKYDRFVQFCGPAVDYETSKSDFHSDLIHNLTCFNFIWSGFEAYLDTLSLPSSPDKRKRGKINSVNYFLKETYIKKYPILDNYIETVSYLKKILQLNPWYKYTYNSFNASNYESNELIGLKIVYSIRNSFAHGSFVFTEPEEFNAVKPLDNFIIQASSRIILLTMQMLLISMTKDLEFKVPQLHEVPEKGIGAKEFLLKMHLKSFEYS